MLNSGLMIKTIPLIIRKKDTTVSKIHIHESTRILIKKMNLSKMIIMCLKMDLK